MFRNILITSLAIFCCQQLIGQQPFTCKGQFFMTKYDGTGTSLLEVVIDPNTQRAVFDQIRYLPGVSLNAIGFRSTDNLIYALDVRNLNLMRYGADGEGELVGPLDIALDRVYLGADITPDGRFMYMMESERLQANNPFIDENLLIIDLEDPNLGIRRIPIQGGPVNMLDVAFDPRDGSLFGYDSKNQQLVLLDPNTGEILRTFAQNTNIEPVGSLFFDAFGNLFAYGFDGETSLVENPTRDQNALFFVDKETGLLTKLTDGELAGASDACTCPYTVQMNKFVEPRVTTSCTKVLYYFEIASLSMFTQEGLTFIDELPNGFSLVEVLENPFGGTVESVAGDRVIRISDMTVNPGLDTIVVEVFLNGVPGGTYANQARITGLDESLGETTVSDDPITLVKFDSTRLEVIEFIDQDTIYFQQALCSNVDEIFLDADRFGSSFLWEDGSTDGIRSVDAAGRYVVEARNNCGVFYLAYDVFFSNISVAASPSSVDIIWGDTVDISVDIKTTDEPYVLNWTDPLGGSISCLSCANPRAFPAFDVTYTVQAVNNFGCLDTAIVDIRVDRDYFYYIPNAFSPNADQTNDTFFIQGSRNGIVKKLQIFDRWGNKMYDIDDSMINDPTAGWDGTFKTSQMQPGVYVYVADLVFLNEIEIREKGDLYLVK